jgi:SAM-dependent methyltransferase
LRSPTEDRLYWSRVADRYQPAGGETFSRLYIDAANRALLARWLPSRPVRYLLKTDAFEEACGPGLAAPLLASSQSAIGLDCSFATLAAAHARHEGMRLVEADVRLLPFGDGTLDLVVSNSTLDHFRSRSEIESSLRELHRVLRPRGQLIVTLDNLAQPLIALRNAVPYQVWRRIGLVPYYVGASFGPRGLRGALVRAGFQVVELDAIMHFPRWLAELVTKLAIGRLRGRLHAPLLRLLMAFDRLLDRPASRFVTGQFVAARAVKP